MCMYIRKTQIQKKKSGGHYYTNRIVKSQRIGKKGNPTHSAKSGRRIFFFRATVFQGS